VATVTAMEGVEPGLRERKKQRTREQIIERATPLFAERGFEAVTVAEIAAAAEIAPRTFFAYFPTKEDVVFHDAEAVLGAMQARLAQRPPGETTLDALHTWLRALILSVDPADEMERCRQQAIDASPSLQARRLQMLGRFEAALAEALRDDLEGTVGARMAAAVAAATLSTLETAFHSVKGQAEFDGGAVVDEAFAFLRAGIAALQARAPS
jgi:AcrR family transcriptional regulator